MLSIKKRYWIDFVLHGITCVAAVSAMLLWFHPFLKFVLKGSLVICVASVMADIGIFVKQRHAENMDERDNRLMDHSANQAITAFTVTMACIIGIYLVLVLLNPELITMALAILIIVMNLPSVFKYGFFLYNESHDSEEFFE